jgi:hypothetical protein
MQELTDHQQSSRRKIKEVLQLLSSVEEQLEYQRNVPHVNIVGELICDWFDHSYWPDDKDFVSGFSEAESAALSEFNAVFEHVVAPIRYAELPQITSLVQTPEWTSITQTAKKTLSILEFLYR